VADRVEERVELLVQPFDFGFGCPLVDLPGMLCLRDRQLAEFVQDDRRRLPEVQDGVRRTRRDGTDHIQFGEFPVRQAGRLPSEYDGDGRVDSPQRRREVGRFERRVADVARRVLVCHRRTADRVVRVGQFREGQFRRVR